MLPPPLVVDTLEGLGGQRTVHRACTRPKLPLRVLGGGPPCPPCSGRLMKSWSPGGWGLARPQAALPIPRGGPEEHGCPQTAGPAACTPVPGARPSARGGTGP